MDSRKLGCRAELEREGGDRRGKLEVEKLEFRRVRQVDTMKQMKTEAWK